MAGTARGMGPGSRSATLALWGIFLIVTKSPREPAQGGPTTFRRNQPFLTCQGQGVVPPTSCGHNCFMAETLNESGGFNSLGVAMSQLPFLIPTCRPRAR